MRLLCGLLVVLALVGIVSGQSFCDKYSQLLFNSTDGPTEQKLITAIITRAVLGESTSTPPVPGIVGANSILLPWFDGSIQYRHRGQPPAPNFLTDKDAFAALAASFVSFAGYAFGCTGTPFNLSNWDPNQQRLHELMGIGQQQMDYFDTQLALTLLSFGVTPDDVRNIAVPLLEKFQRGAGKLEICRQANCVPIAEPVPPAALSFCEKYAYALFGSATAQAEIELITTVVTTFVLGSGGKSGHGVTVAGLAAPGSPLLSILNGTVPYRQDGSKPPNYLTDSAALGQLATKFVEFIGLNLGCASYGFPLYPTVQSQNYIHALMQIDAAKMGYFDTQVATTLVYYGVPASGPDIAAAAAFLASFNKGAGRNEICTTDDCPRIPSVAAPVAASF
jgi:hypothetical protein